MSHYALNADALRSVTAKWLAQGVREDATVQEFARDLLLAMLDKGPIRLAGPVHLQKADGRAALQLQAGHDWAECPIAIYPEPDPELCAAALGCDCECGCTTTTSTTEEPTSTTGSSTTTTAGSTTTTAAPTTTTTAAPTTTTTTLPPCPPEDCEGPGGSGSNCQCVVPFGCIPVTGIGDDPCTCPGGCDGDCCTTTTTTAAPTTTTTTAEPTGACCYCDDSVITCQDGLTLAQCNALNGTLQVEDITSPSCPTPMAATCANIAACNLTCDLGSEIGDPC